MSTQHGDAGTGEYGFPLVRRGYERSAVDAFARDAHAEITGLRRQYETLAGHYAQLQAAHDQAAQAPTGEADFSGVGGRAQEILRIAEEQALDITGRAGVDADRLREQTEHEVQMLREHAAAELAETRGAEVARLDGLRVRSERQAAALVEGAVTEARQLLEAAQFEAAAVQAEAASNARAGVETAQLQAATVLADAERDALTLRQQAAEHRDEVLAGLSTEAEDLRERIEQTMAESTRMHRRAAEHLASEAAEAGRLRDEALAEVEHVRAEAVAEAEELLARAQQQAATLEERSRQEFAWRRRQLRQEQDLLARRKQAMLSQLTSLSALAVETAESMPDVPELVLTDDQAAFPDELVPADPDEPALPEEPVTSETEPDSPEPDSPEPDSLEPGAPEPDRPEAGAEGQNSRSSASSMPRSAS